MENRLAAEKIEAGAFSTELHDVIDSTNDRAKALAAEGRRNICVIADRQTGGRGRMGRQFFSPAGCGLYLSLLLSPAVSGGDSALLTTFAAVAVSEVIEELTGTSPAIKWVNDVYLGGRKICGILTEGAIDFATGKFSYAVLGIGINVQKVEFPAEIAGIASDIETETGVKVDRNELVSKLLARFADMETALAEREFMTKYRERCFVIGKEVAVYRGNEHFNAKALDVNDRGELLVLVGNETRVLQSGEISVRIT